MVRRRQVVEDVLLANNRVGIGEDRLGDLFTRSSATVSGGWTYSTYIVLGY